VQKEGAEKWVAEADGILVPGGFGDRGIEGKILAIQYAREKQIPFFGICLGMQLAVVEFARNVCGLKGANSGEFSPETPYPVIDLLPDQKQITKKGGQCAWGLPCSLAGRHARPPGVSGNPDFGASSPSL